MNTRIPQTKYPLHLYTLTLFFNLKILKMEKGKVAGTAPQMEQIEAGKTYAWCTCGESENQPWCNGAHKGSAFTPNVFQAETSKMAAMCTCKQTSNPPFCDGSHNKL